MGAQAIYLDTCALNRLTDDLSQPRLLAEERAITTIFALIDSREIVWIASTLLAFEIAKNPNPYKRVFAASFLPPKDQLISATAQTMARAAQFTQQGLAPADALHLALAEQAEAAWFITTDDRLLRRTANREQPPECINPVDWLRRRQLWLVPKS
jgi:predicted nucleic acid-binding protein